MRAASPMFQSLVQRSISAWNGINYVAEDKDEAIPKYTDMLRNIQSLQDLLETREFWFFQRRECFLKQKLLAKWDPAALDEYILLPIHYGFVNNKECFFVSHYWHTEEHPDPKGTDMHLFQMDLQGLEWSYIWVDWTCMPQSPRDSAQEE
jgi:hypothetical protein